MAGCWPEHAARPEWPQMMLRPGREREPCRGRPGRTRCRPRAAEPLSPLLHYFQKVPPCANYSKCVHPYMVRASRLASPLPRGRGCCHFKAPGGPGEVTEGSCFCPDLFSATATSSPL